MGGPFLGPRPNLTIGEVTFASPVIWDWIREVETSGGSFYVSSTDPASRIYNGGGGDGEVWGYPPINARSWSPRETVDSSASFYLWAMPIGKSPASLNAAGYNLYGVAENWVIPVHQTATEKCTGLVITQGQINAYASWQGDGKYWRDAALATVAVVAIAAGVAWLAAPAAPAAVEAAAGAGGITTTEAAAGAGGITTTEAATVVGTGAKGFTLAEVAAGAKTAAGIATSGATVIKAVSQASNAGINWDNVAQAAKNAATIAQNGEKAKASIDNLLGDPNTLLYIGAAVVAVLVL